MTFAADHSAWMRQDKMFAMLKFRDRTDATAFPHAFALTIKTLNGPTTEDRREAPENPEKISTASNGTDSDEKKNSRLLEAPMKDETEDEGIPDAPRTRQSIIKTESNNDEINEPETSNGSSGSECKKDLDRKTPAKRPKALEKIDNSFIKRRNIRRGGNTEEENTNDKSLPDSPTEKGIAADFADLPYQYIIEKEIENSKNISDDSNEPISGISHKKSCQIQKSSPRTPKLAQVETTAGSTADITDLVMEGLMFTIRQDQDSVTVVEQKTKLEMDEVLENSVKAETKEGEKCLLNSSLLRLENLITKIEMSEARIKKHKEEIALSSPKSIEKDATIETNLSAYNPTVTSPKLDAYRSHYDNSESWKYQRNIEMPKLPLVKIDLNNIGDALSDTFQFHETSKIEDTGEIEEVAMDIDGYTRDLRKIEDEEEEDEDGLELRYEDKEDTAEEDSSFEEDIVPEAFVKNGCNIKIPSTIDETLTDKSIEQTKSNTPRIISNEIVTYDQIPLVLQNALRYKREKCLNRNKIKETNALVKELPATNNNKEIEMVTTEDKLPEICTPVTRSMKEIEASTIDLTEEFEREITSVNSRRQQPNRRKSARHAEQRSVHEHDSNAEPETRVDMIKLYKDLKRGARVVVHRLDLTNISSSISITNRTSLSKLSNSSRRYPTLES